MSGVDASLFAFGRARCRDAEFGESDLLQESEKLKGDTMSIIWAIVIGLLVGIVAKFLMPGRQGGGMIVTALLGIVGAVGESHPACRGVRTTCTPSLSVKWLSRSAKT